MAVSGVAGWISGRADGDSASKIAAQRAAAARAENLVAIQRERAAWLQSANARIERLNARRSDQRRRLGAARRPSAQARLAGLLAGEFALAASAIGSPPAAAAERTTPVAALRPAAAAPEGTTLVVALRRSARAYRGLAAAVDRGRRARYRRAVRRVRIAEADVRRAIDGLGG